MQSRYFKRLLPLTAVALLILAFLAIELDATPGPCERSEIQAGERREPLAATQPGYLSYEEAVKRAESLMPKYEDLFWRQPNIIGVQVEGLSVKDEIGNYIEVPEDAEGGNRLVASINIYVTKKVDQCTLSPEDRIPDIIEGVPVQIIETILIE